MNSEISNQQNHFHKHSDWLSQVDDLNDSEAVQVNGGVKFNNQVNNNISKYLGNNPQNQGRNFIDTAHFISMWDSAIRPQINADKHR